MGPLWTMAQRLQKLEDQGHLIFHLYTHTQNVQHCFRDGNVLGLERARSTHISQAFSFHKTGYEPGQIYCGFLCSSF